MKTYKQLSKELDLIMQELQSGEVAIDASIDKYKQASVLIKKMEEQLAKAKVEIKKIEDSTK